MIVHVNNEYQFSFLENVSIKDFHTHMLKKIDSYHLLITRLEDYERNYTDFNMIELVKVIYNEAYNLFTITIKINDLLAYDKSPFYYKDIVVKF